MFRYKLELLGMKKTKNPKKKAIFVLIFFYLPLGSSFDPFAYYRLLYSWWWLIPKYAKRNSPPSLFLVLPLVGQERKYF